MNLLKGVEMGGLGCCMLSFYYYLLLFIIIIIDSMVCNKW